MQESRYTQGRKYRHQWKYRYSNFTDIVEKISEKILEIHLKTYLQCFRTEKKKNLKRYLNKVTNKFHVRNSKHFQLKKKKKKKRLF